MSYRFTFSITVSKYGEERWIFSQKNNVEMGKTSVWETYIPFFICTYIYFTYNTDEEIIDFEI